MRKADIGFGDSFTRTFNRYTQQLLSNPPKYVIGGLLGSETTASRIMSAPLQEVLRSRYKLRAMARHTAPATDASQALFERRF